MDSFFRNTLGPTAWTAIALVPPAIFALYFLKLKRSPVEVPSTYLWHRVIEDLHVNSLWQRLRRSLLLLLQLLVVGLAILALLRPGWQGQRLSGQKFIFMIDNSASMNADDADNQTRLAAAKRQVAGLIDQLESDMSAMLVAFSDGPDLIQEFTDNRRLLRDSLERIQPTSRTTSVRGALELASGFANPEKVMIQEGGNEFDVAAQEPVELFLLSDGRFGPVEGFSLGNLHPLYLPFGSFESNNLAITAFNTRGNENDPDERQAFVQVVNAADPKSASEVSVDVELFLDNTLIDAAELKVPAGRTASYTFDLGDVAEGSLRAKLTPPTDYKDALELDNTAYAVLDPNRDARVLLVTPGNATLEIALGTERAKRVAEVVKVSPEQYETPERQREVEGQVYNLVIFDQSAPKQMPPTNTLFIGRIPPLKTWQSDSSKAPQFNPQIIDWQRSHPLLNLVELGNVQIVDSLLVDPPQGGKVLIDSTKGPIAAIAPRGPYEDAVLGFELIGRDKDGNVNVNTNWPRSFSFPNFCFNVLEYFAGNAAQLDQQSRQPGEAVELKLGRPVEQATKKVTITLPNQETRSVELGEHGRFTFHEADQIGIYEVSDGDKLLRRFAVNLFDRQESDVRLRTRQDDKEAVKTVESLSIGYTDVAAAQREMPVRKELWRWLLLAVLAVLFLEWYIYNRRVYV